MLNRKLGSVTLAVIAASIGIGSATAQVFKCESDGKEAITSVPIAPEEMTTRQLVQALAKAGDVGLVRYQHKNGQVLIAASDGTNCDIKAKPVDGPKAAKTPADDDKNKEFKVNFVVPASPAFDLLGLNPSAVSSPSSLRDLAVALVDGRDKDGRLKSGLALDIAPFQWYRKSHNVGKLPDDPEENGFDKNFTRVRISLATAQGRETADQSLKLAAGLGWVFFDATNREKKEMKKACNPVNVVERKSNLLFPAFFAGRTLADISDAKRLQITSSESNPDAVAKLCEKEIEKLSWSERKASLGVGRAWFTETGKLSDRAPSSSGLWLSYSQNIGYFENLEKSLQFATIFRRARGETVIDPAPAAGATAKPIKQDANTVGLRLKFGQKNGTISIEQSQTRQQMAGRLKETVKRNAVGFDWHIYGDVWIVASGGSVSGRLYGENKPFVLTSIRYGGEKGE